MKSQQISKQIEINIQALLAIQTVEVGGVEEEPGEGNKKKQHCGLGRLKE